MKTIISILYPTQMENGIYTITQNVNFPKKKKNVTW